MKPIQLISKLHRLPLFFGILPNPKVFFASLFIVLTFLATSPFGKAANETDVPELCSVLKERRVLLQLPKEDLKEAIMPIHDSIYGDLQTVFEQIPLHFQELKFDATREDLETMFLNNMSSAFLVPMQAIGGLISKINKDIETVITTFERNLTQQERSILGEYLYILSDETPTLSHQEEAYRALTATPFDVAIFIQKNNEYTAFEVQQTMDLYTTMTQDRLLPIVSILWNGLQATGFMLQDKRFHHPKFIKEVNLKIKTLAEDIRREFANFVACM